MKSYGVRKNINGEKEIAKRCRLQSDAVCKAMPFGLPTNCQTSTSQHLNIATSQHRNHPDITNETIKQTMRKFCLWFDLPRIVHWWCL